MEWEIVVAKESHVPAIAALARSELPGMTWLHDPVDWLRTYHRFGSGETPQSNLCVIVRELPSKEVQGFCWVDAAMYHDHGVEEAWWCINALMVAPPVRRRGLGRQVVAYVKEKASNAGVNSIYGVCYSSSVEFWRAQDFEVSQPGGKLRSDRPVLIPARGRNVLTFGDQEGDHMIVFAS